MRHIAGNMLSRGPDFLTTDGEKPTRDRDSEFTDWTWTRRELLAYWESGWKALFAAIEPLTEADIQQTIHIRGEGLSYRATRVCHEPVDDNGRARLGWHAFVDADVLPMDEDKPPMPQGKHEGVQTVLVREVTQK